MSKQLISENEAGMFSDQSSINAETMLKAFLA